MLATLLAPFSAVTVESHARTVGRRATEFAARLTGRLEVAIGLETIHPDALPRLNKQMTLEDFSRAAEFLGSAGIGLRAFVLLGAPFVPAAETVEWTRRSVAYALGRGARHVTIIPARDAGLSPQQLGLLTVLHHSGGQGVSILGEELGVSSAAASQMIERLVQQGLLERCEDPSDRRVRQVQLTPKGTELVEKGMQARREWIEKLRRALTTEEQEKIAIALTHLTEAAQAMEKQSQRRSNVEE